MLRQQPTRVTTSTRLQPRYPSAHWHNARAAPAQVPLQLPPLLLPLWQLLQPPLQQLPPLPLQPQLHRRRLLQLLPSLLLLLRLMMTSQQPRCLARNPVHHQGGLLLCSAALEAAARLLHSSMHVLSMQTRALPCTTHSVTARHLLITSVQPQRQQHQAAEALAASTCTCCWSLLHRGTAGWASRQYLERCTLRMRSSAMWTLQRANQW